MIVYSSAESADISLNSTWFSLPGFKAISLGCIPINLPFESYTAAITLTFFSSVRLLLSFTVNVPVSFPFSTFNVFCSVADCTGKGVEVTAGVVVGSAVAVGIAVGVAVGVAVGDYIG
mgnify:CR=1 FL=1